MKQQHTLEELVPLITEWANERGLINESFIEKQRLKLIEECGELASAILKENIEEQKDAIGDIFVVLVILAEQAGDNNYNFEDDGYYEVLDILISGICCDSIESRFSYLINVVRDLDFDLTECVNLAWNEIKDRKGKLVNGTFIKN